MEIFIIMVCVGHWLLIVWHMEIFIIMVCVGRWLLIVWHMEIYITRQMMIIAGGEPELCW